MKDIGYSGLTILLVLGLVTGCASGPSLVPVEDSETRLEFDGFSVLPPTGRNWQWVGRAGAETKDLGQTVFVKRDGERTYVSVAGPHPVTADISDSEKLRNYVSNQDTVREIESRQQNVNSRLDVVEEFGVTCVRFDMDAEDHGVPGRSGVVFKLDAHGYYCRKPDSEGELTYLAYTRRAPQGQTYLAGAEEGERFLGSFLYTSR
jgi:hypothetical protein